MEQEKIENAIQPEKPPFLHHGSSVGNIGMFEPRVSANRPEPARVYASPDRRVARMSTLNAEGVVGGTVDGVNYVCIPQDREEFLANDKGGYLYSLPSDSFSINNGLGLLDAEWVSEIPVEPSSVAHSPSRLEAAKEDGTKVYFVTPEQREEILAASEENDVEKLKQLLAALLQRVSLPSHALNFTCD